MSEVWKRFESVVCSLGLKEDSEVTNYAVYSRKAQEISGPSLLS